MRLLSLVAFSLALRLPIVALPEGFADQLHTIFPDVFVTSMNRLPGGELLVGLRDGRIHVFRPGEQPAEPFAVLSTWPLHEGGIIGIVAAPDFESSRRIYVNYTEHREGRIFLTITSLKADVHDHTTAEPGSEEVIFSIEDTDPSVIHFGGGLLFGQDGMLYVGVGDDAIPATAQDPGSLRGKVLRMTPQGEVPPDNPDFGAGVTLVYAMGLRNPFRLYADELTGEMFVNDVGQSTWEEVNRLQYGANYGWPIIEGPLAENPGTTPPANYVEPLYTYGHDWWNPLGGQSAVDGLIYRGGKFPPEYEGRHFVADWEYTQGKIFALEKDEHGVVSNASLWAITPKPVTDLVEIDGDLFYSTTAFDPADHNFTEGQIRRILVTDNLPPTISATANLTSGTIPLHVEFSADVQDDELSGVVVEWQFGDGQAAIGKYVSHTYQSPGIYPVTAVARDAEGAIDEDRTIQVWAGRERFVHLRGTVSEVASGTPQPVSGTIGFYRNSNWKPHPIPGSEQATMSFHEGMFEIGPANVIVYDEALLLSVLSERAVPFTTPILPDENGNLILDSQFSVGQQAVVGRIETARGDGIAGAILTLDVFEEGDWHPVSFPGEGIEGAGISTHGGWYYLPVGNPHWGKRARISLDQSSPVDFLPRPFEFLVPRVGGATWVPRIGRIGDGREGGLPEPSGNVVSQSEAIEILSRQCSGCHGNVKPYGNLDLTEGFAFSQLVEVSSQQAAGMPLVRLRNPNESYLLEKLAFADPQVGKLMPAGSRLPEDELQKIVDWIATARADGAPKDLRVAMSVTEGESPLLVELRAAVNGGEPPFQFAWNLGGEMTRHGSTVNYAFAAEETTSFEIGVTVQGAQGESLSTSRTITVHPPQPRPEVGPWIFFHVASSYPRPGHPVRFNAAQSGGPWGQPVRYEWDFDNDGVADWISTEPEVEWVFEKTGRQIVRLRGIDRANHVGETTRELFVNVPAFPEGPETGLFIY